MKKKILATSWHPGGANAIAPVIKSLDGKIEIITLGYEHSEKIFGNSGINYRTLKEYNLRNVSLNSMNKLLDFVHPSLILTGTSIQDKEVREVIEQTMVLSSRNKGIVSLSVMDMGGNYWKRFSDLYDNYGRFREEIYETTITSKNYTKKDGKFKFLPSKIAIIDDLSKKEMISEGFEENTLEITGNPFFDDIIRLKKEFNEKEKVRSDLGINQRNYMILFASQPIENTYGEKLGYTEKTVLEELLKSVKQISQGRGISVLVKIHPREDIRNLERIVREEEFRELEIRVNKEYDPKDALMASDAVVSAFSTTLIESTYLDLPSISLQPGLKAKDYLSNTNDLGITIPVYQKGELEGILRKLISEESYRQELAMKRRELKIDGKATERVVSLIYNMLNL